MNENSYKVWVVDREGTIVSEIFEYPNEEAFWGKPQDWFKDIDESPLKDVWLIDHDVLERDKDATQGNAETEDFSGDAQV